MKIAVFGATGGTGKLIADKALAAGHQVTALARNATNKFKEIIKLTPAMPDQVKVAALNTETPGPLTDLIAANLNLNLEDRQQLLETPNVLERLQKLRPLLAA